LTSVKLFLISWMIFLNHEAYPRIPPIPPARTISWKESSPQFSYWFRSKTLKLIKRASIRSDYRLFLLGSMWYPKTSIIQRLITPLSINRHSENWFCERKRKWNSAQNPNLVRISGVTQNDCW
jgi:hypothetical protein